MAGSPSSPTALLVAHGSPSDPESQETALRDLAALTQTHMPEDWRVEGVTLAAKGRFEQVIAELGTPLIYPFFMARGWFTGQVLARKARAMGLRMLDPFGVEPELIACARRELGTRLAGHGWQAAETALIVAAHGSAVSRTSADSAYHFARMLHSGMGFRTTRTGFIEQPPFLKDVAQDLGQAIALPYFAQQSGHIEDDVPAALSAAGFNGPILPPFIAWADTPALIAASIRRQALAQQAG